jgi:hypothetical protein
VARVPVASVSQDGIVDLVGRVRAHPEEPVCLDLSEVGSSRHRRLSVEWGLVLSNLLLGEFRSSDIRLQLPDSHSLARPLARSGLPFVIARRRLRWSGLGQDRSWVSRWSSDWEPSVPLQPQFDLGESDELYEPHKFERFLVGFLNPDVQPQDRISSEGASVVRPWLRDMYSWMSPEELRGDPNELAEVIGGMTEELVENIRLHADLDRRSGTCFVNLFITRGGGVESGNRLYIAALDNGVGFPSRTLSRPELRGLTATERVERALNGELDPYDRGRGRGWRDIKSVGAKWGGRVFVATGPVGPGASGAIVLSGEFTDRLTAVEVPDLPVRGSVVLIEIPMTVGTERPRRSERVQRRPQEPQLALN